MRGIVRLSVWVLVAAIGIASGTAHSGDELLTVPSRTSEIQDDILKAALEEYSPTYDSLSRGEQTQAFVNIYKALNGMEPSIQIDAQDSVAYEVDGQYVELERSTSSTSFTDSNLRYMQQQQAKQLREHRQWVSNINKNAAARSEAWRQQSRARSAAPTTIQRPSRPTPRR